MKAVTGITRGALVALLERGGLLTRGALVAFLTRGALLTQGALVALLLLAAAPGGAFAEKALGRSDAESWLSALERAYSREDLEAVLALSGDDSLRRLASHRVGRLFEARNYLQLSHRIVELSAREDGSLEIEVLETLRSRPATSPSDLREKSRRRHRLDRIDGRVVLVESLPADSPVLPAHGAFVAEEWKGSVAFHPQPLAPFGSPEGRAEIRFELRLRNVSPEAAEELSFGLHPFVSDLSLRTGSGESLNLRRHEGTADVWSVPLEPSVPAGAALVLELEYALDEVGDGPHGRIGPDGAHLFPEAAWHPLLARPLIGGTNRAAHDLRIEVPAGWSAVAPGTLAETSELPDGRRSFRWFSRFPAESLVIVAGELERSESRLEGGLVAELWRQPGRGAPPVALFGRLSSMSAHLSGLLGPPPVERIAIVESLGPGLRQQPGFFVLGDLAVDEAEAFQRVKERQPLFFLAHHLAHLWLVDAVLPVGGAAQVLSEALCDQVAFDWMDAAVDPRVSHWHREAILQRARARPDGDRPLLATRPGEPGGEIFGQGKALVVLDGYRSFAGRTRWIESLKDHALGRRGQQVGVGELLASLGGGDARLEDYVGTWIVGQGFADIAVSEPRARELIDEATGKRAYEIELEIANEGLGPVPVELRILEDRFAAEWEDRLLELGSHERTILRFQASAPIRRVEADPHDRTWQSVVRNDDFPEQRPRPKSLPGQQRQLTDRDKERLENLLGD